jgi:hypothetical protein
MHPWKQLVLHVDFQRVSADQKIHMKVPLHFINAEIAPGVKTGGGIVSHVMNEIDITCLPDDLPEFVEVDLKALVIEEARVDMGPLLGGRARWRPRSQGRAVPILKRTSHLIIGLSESAERRPRRGAAPDAPAGKEQAAPSAAE